MLVTRGGRQMSWACDGCGKRGAVFLVWRKEKTRAYQGMYSVHKGCLHKLLSKVLTDEEIMVGGTFRVHALSGWDCRFSFVLAEASIWGITLPPFGRLPAGRAAEQADRLLNGVGQPAATTQKPRKSPRIAKRGRR